MIIMSENHYGGGSAKELLLSAVRQPNNLCEMQSKNATATTAWRQRRQQIKNTLVSQVNNLHEVSGNCLQPIKLLINAGLLNKGECGEMRIAPCDLQSAPALKLVSVSHLKKKKGLPLDHQCM